MSEFNLKNRSFTHYDGIQKSANNQLKISDGIVVEAALQININGEAYTVVMRTPGDDQELIRGLLYAEDIYRDQEPLGFELIEEQDNGFSIINVRIPETKLGKGYLNKRTLLSVSSCGICGKKELDQITLDGTALSNSTIPSLEAIEQMSQQMNALQSTFKETGGSHATAIFDSDYKLLSLKEDIGRHNALDKAIGDLVLKNHLSTAKIALVSGRVSYEIVSKAFFAKISTIIAVSACSSLAIDYAKEFGITLIGFNRNQKITIYSNS